MGDLVNRPFVYEMTILEHHIDTFGHVNHATYLQILEQARWEWTTRGGYGVEDIKRTGVGPIVTELSIRYGRELNLRENIRVVSHCKVCRSRIITIEQTILKENGELAAMAEVNVCLFNTTTRKLVSPSPQWLRAIGIPEA